MTQAFLLFHLNLAFSSIPEAQRSLVIQRCYTPLLDLAEHGGFPLGIELTGWTLERIEELDPAWVERLGRLLRAGLCELVGSGYCQIIGPLVPEAVNRWNQRLGQETYHAILGCRPSLALVNEMAYASGLVPIYRDVGYQGIVMDRDNIRLALDLQDQPYEAVPSHAAGPDGSTLPVLWTDSILFQKLQRLAHGESSLMDYLNHFRKRAATATRPLAAYSNDAEVFDFRPGRFREEAVQGGESEWARVAGLLAHLRDAEAVEWLLPAQALAASLERHGDDARTLTSIRQPVPVKKQAKYNLSRWAVSGRNDLWLNSRCHRRYRQLAGSEDAAAWRQLCRLWASDLRTHITEARWQAACDELERLSPPQVTDDALVPLDDLGPWAVRESADGIFLNLETADLRLVLNLRKGLTVRALAFRSQDFVPVVGTLPHGYFESIDYGADFYTGGVIVELPGEHRRVTDLVPAVPEYFARGDDLCIRTRIDTASGPIVKTVVVPRRGERLELGFDFPGWSRPRGIVRVGTTTLLPEAFRGPLTMACHNGGGEMESFPLDRNCDHAHPTSSLVSCTTGLGATTGRLLMGNPERVLALEWNPAETAAFPLVMHQKIPPTHLTRVLFSLAELDDTSRPEGDLPSFRYTMRPVPPLGGAA